MNRVLAMMAAMMAADAAFAVPSWASINTDAYKGKTGMDNVTSYSAYYCTADAAKDMFGATTVSALTTYFKSNFADGESELKDGATALTDASWSSVASYYTFFGSLVGDPEADSYVGFVLFGTGDEGDRAFRVFGANNPETDANYVAFDYAEGTDVGAWTTVVPEPTSALLMLLGVAGLALKRRRA